MKLLLIMPCFFDYPEAIKEELTSMGYQVDYFDDRPSTSGLIKAIIRIKKDLIYKYIRRYFNQMMEVVRKQTYDVVFLISGQSLSFDENMLSELKSSQPQARFLLYQWDSLNNFPYIKNVQKYFEKCYSFDRNDAAINTNLKFLPLFYSKRYEQIGQQMCGNFEYDFCFVGTAHPKKYKFINLISEQLREVYPKQFIYFFYPSRLVFFYRKLVNKELHHAHYNEFHYVPLKGTEMSRIYESSKSVLDSAQDGQIGLTIRVLEALGAKKKIITTNDDIVNYDFYCPENIYIYKDTIDLTDVFFTKPYKEIEEKVYKKYSLNSWLTEILSL